MPTAFTDEELEHIRSALIQAGIRLSKELGLQKMSVEKLTSGKLLGEVCSVPFKSQVFQQFFNGKRGCGYIPDYLDIFPHGVFS